MSNEDESPLGRLSWLTATAGTLGSLVPGWAYFAEQAPPAAEESALVLTALGLAVVVYGLRRPLKAKPALGKALTIIVLAVVLIIGYGVARDYTTSGYPADYELPVGQEHLRLQTGFGLAPWSLTEAAKKALAQPAIRRVEDLMLAFPGAYAGQVELVWKPWTITAAGLLLIILFTIGFLLWAYGFAMLARALAA